MSRTAVTALLACCCLSLAACNTNKTTEGSAAIDGAKECCAEGEKVGCSEAKAEGTCAEGAAAKACCSQKQ